MRKFWPQSPQQPEHLISHHIFTTAVSGYDEQYTENSEAAGLTNFDIESHRRSVGLPEHGPYLEFTIGCVEFLMAFDLEA